DISNRKWLLREFTNKAILCFDNDQSGIDGRNKAIKQMIPLINIEVIELPDPYKDAAEIDKKEIFDECYKKRDILNY
ncbi:MAG: toprim domain-containing protein, partial [bacterium]